MHTFNCAGVIFDLDGVLVDSSIVIERHWRRWATEHELDIAAILATMTGKRNIEVMSEFAPHLDMEKEAAEMDALEALDRDGLRRFPGSKRILATIPVDRWAVATSGSRDTASLRLKTTALPIPSALVTANDVSEGKPHPESYIRAAEQLGIPPHSCVVVEDAPSGVRAARAAGMTVVAVTSSLPAEELLHADAIIPALLSLNISMDAKQENATLIDPVIRINLQNVLHLNRDRTR